MSEMERKYGRYAIRNLPLVMIVMYGIGYMITMIAPSLLYRLTLDPYAIVHGQVWRILSWLLILPDYSNSLTMVIILYCYYSIGRALEHIWGTWRFNVFILRGILLTVAAAFVWMGFSYLTGFAFAEIPTVYGAEAYFSMFSQLFSTYYLNLSIVIAFAMTLPDAQFLLFFLIPVKAKYIALLDVIYLGYYFFAGTLTTKFAVLAAFLNILIFYLTSPGRVPGTLTGSRRRAWKAAVDGKRPFQPDRRSAQNGTGNGQGTAANAGQRMNPRRGLLHRCAICGRTNADHPELEFRYCSKCEGGVEYCQDHLFTHVHIRAGEKPGLYE